MIESTVALNDLAPWTPSLGDSWDDEKAAHLLRRAGFGHRPEQIKTVVDLGMERAVETLLNADTVELPTSGTVTLPHGEILRLTGDGALLGQRALWLYEMIHGAHPLKEKMALFWADHFSVGAENQTAANVMLRHTNVFRRHGLGSFRDMLVDVTRDPAMLLWLDNYLNGRGGEINENYSRELLELYTMGVFGGYTELDVEEAAKCLSGWSLVLRDNAEPRFEFRFQWHVGGPKTVLGQRIYNPGNPQQDGFDLIDLLLAQPVTAEYVAGKVWSFFVAEDPPQPLIQQLAAQWRQGGYDIADLMRTILKSRFFYGDQSVRTLLKNPVEYASGLIRHADVRILNYRYLGIWVEAMGWPLLRYPNPAGFPDGTAWFNSETMIVRGNFANELTRLGGGRTVRARFDPHREIQRHALPTSKAVVDHYLESWLQSDAPQLVRWTLDQFLNRTDTGVTPFRPFTSFADMKMRGFVHLLATLPEYHIN